MLSVCVPQGAKYADRLHRRVNAAATESVLDAVADLDPSWGIVVDPRDLRQR